MANRKRLIDRMTATRTRPMKVLVLGMPRTGTASMYAALRKLGYNCYHMIEAMKNPRRDLNLWSEAVEAEFYGKGKPYGRYEFDKLFGDYDATSDVPSILFVDALTSAYPDAKVILTNRDVDKWLVSMQNTGEKVVMRWHSWRILRYFDHDIVGPWFRFAMLLFGYWGRSKDMRQMYLDHYAHVRAVVPKERLLEFDAAEGWGPLCEFLGHDVPEGPYPRVNDTAGFMEFHRQMWWQSFGKMMRTITAVLVPVAAAGVTAYYYRK